MRVDCTCLIVIVRGGGGGDEGVCVLEGGVKVRSNRCIERVCTR